MEDGSKALKGTKGSFEVKSASLASFEFDDDHKRIQYRGRKRRLQSEIEHWLREFGDFSTIHGMKWYITAPNLISKLFIITFLSFIVIALPVFFIFRTYEFFNSTSVSTAVDWIRADELPYPNVTVCYAKYFDNRWLEAHNISNDMANYMTMALDPNSKGIWENVADFNETFKETLNSLWTDLDDIIDTKFNGSIVDLFQAVAMKCDDFVNLCEIQGKVLFTLPKSREKENCCRDFFDPQPIFTHAGTCYISKARIMEKNPFTYSSVKIWLSSQSQNSPEFNVAFKGSDSVERKGVYFAISDQDHPVTKLLQSPFKATKGTATLVGLSYKKFDQTSLSSKICKVSDLEFEQLYNIPYTKLNCEVFANSKTHLNCSLGPFYGVLKNETYEKACHPEDISAVSSYFNAEGFPCLTSCLYTDYSASITTGTIDVGAIKRYFRIVGREDFGSPEDMMVLQFYFQTFDYETLIFYQESFVDFLSKIGGWLGLIIGASVFSFVELGFWVFLLFFKLLKTLIRSRTE